MRRVLLVVVVVLGVVLVGASVVGLFTSPSLVVLVPDSEDEDEVVETELRCDPLLGLDVPLGGGTVDLREWSDDREPDERRTADGQAWEVSAEGLTTAVRCGDLRTRRVAQSLLGGGAGLVLLLAVRPAVRSLGEAFGREDYVPPDPDAPFRV